tara:strand:+ start:1044 stop:1466 length:423 start_codon:yes stop_codon:yes gene_type:complete
VFVGGTKIMGGIGCMADMSDMDTLSFNPTATYPVQPHGGLNKTYITIYTGGANIIALDPLSQPTPVVGIPTKILVPAAPPTLPRIAPIVGVVNSEARGVYFEKTLVPVIGDAINGAGAIPVNRPLTGLGKHVTIIIGTRS